MVSQSHFTCYLEFKWELNIFLLDDIDPRGKSEWGGGTLPSHDKKSSLVIGTVQHLYSAGHDFNDRDFKLIGKIKHDFQNLFSRFFMFWYLHA